MEQCTSWQYLMKARNFDSAICKIPETKWIERISSYNPNDSILHNTSESQD